MGKRRDGGHRPGILVGGEPAPGINGAIAAATCEAPNAGTEVLGPYDGFRWAARSDTSHVRALTREDVEPFARRGGSILCLSLIHI